jgi:hypothetical protein
VDTPRPSPRTNRTRRVPPPVRTGSPWQPEFCGWAFNLPRGQPLAKRCAPPHPAAPRRAAPGAADARGGGGGGVGRWGKIPSGIDVLVTHGPPLGHGDRIRSKSRVGCVELLRAVQTVRPAYHVFGHVHEDYGVTEDGFGTVYINARSAPPAASRPSRAPAGPVVTRRRRAAPRGQRVHAQLQPDEPVHRLRPPGQELRAERVRVCAHVRVHVCAYRPFVYRFTQWSGTPLRDSRGRYAGGTHSRVLPSLETVASTHGRPASAAGAKLRAAPACQVAAGAKLRTGAGRGRAARTAAGIRRPSRPPTPATRLTCPVSTGGGTRRIRLVREEGRDMSS